MRLSLVLNKNMKIEQYFRKSSQIFNLKVLNKNSFHVSKAITIKKREKKC